jgi:hypothetical protein
MYLRKSLISTAIALSLATSTGAIAEDETCDIGKVHEEVFDKFKLPEIPSSLEDCGIGGFLNFDFSFDFGDIDLSSLFCDFAKDVMGDFKKSMKVDFKIGKDGLNINSPIYSVNTRGIDDMAKDLMYGSTGIKEGAPGVLDQIGTAYEGSITATKNSINSQTYETRTGGSNSSSGTGSTSNFAQAVRNGSSVNISDMQKNLVALENIQTVANSNTVGGNTNFSNLTGGNQSIEGPLGNVNLSASQQARLERLPESSLTLMSENELANYLRLSDTQKLDFGMVPPVTEEEVNTLSVSVKTLSQLKGISSQLDNVIRKVSLTDAQDKTLTNTNIESLRYMDTLELSNYLRLTPSQRNELGEGSTKPTIESNQNSIDKALIDSLFN